MEKEDWGQRWRKQMWWYFPRLHLPTSTDDDFDLGGIPTNNSCIFSGCWRDPESLTSKIGR